MFYLLALFCLCWCRLIDAVQSVSVMEGDSVTLHSNATQIEKDDNVLWKYEVRNTLIAQMKKENQIFSIFDDVLDGRFRDRLKLNNQTGSLTIMNITTEHAGRYELQMIGVELSSKTFNVSVYTDLPVPLISTDCFSSSSSSCSMVCSVVNVSHVTLSWLQGNSLLSSISVSDLSISLSLPLEVEDQDMNYSCVLNNSVTHQTTHLNISDLCQTCEDSACSCCSTEAVIRLVLSVLVGVATVAVLVYDSISR